MDVDIMKDIVSGEDLKSHLRIRGKKFDFKSVKKGREEPYLQDGWGVHREYIKTTRLMKPKRTGLVLEDEIWCLFAKMGFDEMNGTTEFTIPVTDRPYQIPEKQVDIFAKDDETVLFVECKASKNPSKRSFKKDINEIIGLRKKIANSVNKHYKVNGHGEKLKYKWIFATRNIIWNDPDLERADEGNIAVFRDDEIDYYNELVNHVGSAAKFQLLAELFGDQEIPGLNATVPAVKGEMGGAPFYSFILEPKKLLKLSFICHRQKTDKKTVVSYQRMLNKNRLKSIRRYIETGGRFPTNIVLNISSTSKKLRFDPISKKEDGTVFGTLYLPNRYKSAWVIDGQHRLYGFCGSSYDMKVKLPVIAFENLGASEQANMFVDINSQQKKVPTNLLIELYSDLLWDSEKWDEKLLALSSTLINELGKDLGSPLKDKIVFSGKKRSGTVPITTTTLNLIMKKTCILGSVRKGTNHLTPGPLYETDMHPSLLRAKKVIISYLNVFKERMPEHWEIGAGTGGYLCTNNGITALIIVLNNIMDYLDMTASIRCGEMPTDELIQEIIPFADILASGFKDLSHEEIRQFRNQVGGKGQTLSAFGMMEIIKQQDPDFDPPGLSDYRESKKTEFTEKAHILIPKMESMIRGHVISELKREFGEDGKAWWSNGVPLKIRQAAVTEAEADPGCNEPDEKLYIIDYKKIASEKWPLFKDFFSPNPNVRKADALLQMDKLNTIRNKTFHVGGGNVSEDEYRFLEEFNEMLESKSKKEGEII